MIHSAKCPPPSDMAKTISVLPFKLFLSYSMHTKQATEESNLIKIKELNID